MGPGMMLLPVVRAARGDEAPECGGAQCAPWYALSREIGVDWGFGETFVHHMPPNSPGSPNPPG
jgi:hypothetical protein